MRVKCTIDPRISNTISLAWNTEPFLINPSNHKLIHLLLQARTVQLIINSRQDNWLGSIPGSRSKVHHVINIVTIHAVSTMWVLQTATPTERTQRLTSYPSTVTGLRAREILSSWSYKIFRLWFLCTAEIPVCVHVYVCVYIHIHTHIYIVSTNRKYLTSIVLNKERPTWCHLLYYFIIYCSTCFRC